MRTEAAPAHAPAGTDPRDATTPEDLRAGLAHVLKVFVVSRVALALLGLVAVALLPAISPGRVAGAPSPVDVPGWPAPPPPASLGWHNVVTAWERFDALWFLRIAVGGYAEADGSAAFFPAYPLAIRFLSPVLGGHPLAAGLVVSNGAFLGALALLYFLTRTELSEDAARRAVVYAAVFPTSFFFVAPYSESLFLLLVLTSLWAARRRRWWMAGAAGALAAATRNVGALLVVPLVVEAVHQWREDTRAGERDDGAAAGGALLGRLGWSLVVLAGTGAFFLFWRNVAGDWLAPVHQQQQWEREPSVPLFTLGRATFEAFRWIGVYPGGYHLLDWLVVSPALVAAGYAAVRFRPVWGVYAWASLLAPLSFIFADRPFMSLPRLLLPIFPIYWAFAAWGRRRGVHDAIVAVSAGALGLMTVLFVNWYYVF